MEAFVIRHGFDCNLRYQLGNISTTGQSKMSKKFIFLSMLSLAIILFAGGWWFYPQLLGAVSGGTTFVFFSVYGALAYRLYWSLSLALLGVSIGTGTWQSGRVSASPRFRADFLTLLSVGAIAAAGWLSFLAMRARALVAGLDVTLPVSAVALHEAGLFATACVAVTAIILIQIREAVRQGQ